MDNLKPCPFCGAKAVTHEITEDDEVVNAGGSVIMCSGCMASSAVYFDRKENMIEDWNRRAPTPTVAWRVKDFADGWVLFHTEAEAHREASGADNLVQALGVIDDQTP